MAKGQLLLSDGTVFEGVISSQESRCSGPRCSGEVCFTTGMTGYVESITDPSFSGQILCFTYPLIGNYGIPREELWESLRPSVTGVVVSESCSRWSHSDGLHSLSDWLASYGIPLISEVDTRALTKRLRSAGTTLGAITCAGEAVAHFCDPNLRHLVADVSPGKRETFTHPEAKKRVIAVDCGMKSNILRLLRQLPIELVRVPHDDDYTNEPFDALFLSNGPGDPAMAAETTEILRKAMRLEKPIFGICLGTQLMARAVGAKIYKLPFGHRGQNQPCIERKTGRCFITSQNHGYAVDESTLPPDWEVTFHNLNDQSVEGIAHRELPFWSVQFHPEAAPGPTDTQWMFEEFYSWMERCN